MNTPQPGGVDEAELCFKRTIIGPYGSARISATHRLIFKPTRLRLFEGNPSALLISSVRIGKYEQLCSAGAIPVAPLVACEEFSLMTSQPDTLISVEVVNATSEAQAVELRMYGFTPGTGKRLRGAQRYVLGFDQQVIRAGESADLFTQPQIPVLLERIVFDRSFARGLVVEEIGVGETSLLRGSRFCEEELAQEKYMPRFLFGMDAGLPDVCIGVDQKLRVSVKNTSSEDKNFVGLCAFCLEHHT